jgi:hypothetical protein
MISMRFSSYYLPSGHIIKSTGFFLPLFLILLLTHSLSLSISLGQWLILMVILVSSSLIVQYLSLYSWNEWLNFPLKISDLPRDAILGITIWDSYGPGKSKVVGGTAFSIFGKRSTCRQGIYDLRIWPGTEATKGNGTPGKIERNSAT